jgi:hypothetical protein
MRVQELKAELVDLQREAHNMAAEMPTANPKDMKVFSKVLVALEDFMKARRGRIKRILEEAIQCPPINCQQNPYYAGSFNGNDCFRLICNLPRLMLLIQDTTLYGYDTQEEMDGVKDIVDRHIPPLWESWERITTVMRSMEELLVEEENKMHVEIAVFDKLFDENTSAKRTSLLSCTIFLIMPCPLYASMERLAFCRR